MVNALNINGQSAPDKHGVKSVESSLDNNLAENSQENLDARLDHAIEETFPTSDSVSVTITKGPEPDQEARSPLAGDQPSQPEQPSTEHLLDQVQPREPVYRPAHGVQLTGEHCRGASGHRPGLTGNSRRVLSC